jgi:hypothetical protein
VPVEIIKANTLDPIYISLDGPRTPADGESSLHSRPITVEVSAEAAQLRRTSGLDVSNPLIELGATSLAHQDQEALSQSTGRT